MKNRHIVVRYTMKPKPGVKTEIKGWMNDDNNIQWDEAFAMTVGLKNKDLMEAQVILDIDDNKIVKNWKTDEDSSYEKLIEYYLKNYAKYMTDFISATNKLPENT